MDPLSIIGSVVGLTATCLQTTKALHDLKGKFENATITISAICTETTIISMSLSRIQSSMLKDSDALGERIREANLDLTIDAALTGCYVVFDVLQSEINKITGPEDSDPVTTLGFRGKAKVVWNESLMQELLGQLRGQQTALTLLLQSLTTDTISELREMMDVNMTVLSQVVERTRNFRASKQSRAPGSIFDMSFTTLSIHQGDGGSVLSQTAFPFDDEIINSQAYRRTLAKAYAAINDQSVEETVTSTPENAPQELDNATTVSVRSSATAFDLRTSCSASPPDTSNRAEVVNMIPIAEESIDKVLNRSSHYIGVPKEWATHWNIRRSEIESVPKRDLERQFIIHEIIYSERQFLKQLLVLRYLYKHRFILARQMEVSSKLVWPGAEDIFEIHKKNLYEPLLARQTSQGPWIQSIADIFEKWVPLSVTAIRDFSGAFMDALNAITLEARRNALFSQFLQQGRDHRISERLDWSHYLKAPLTRLQRYILLLEVTLKNSNPENPQHDCERLKRVIDDIRQMIRQCDETITQKEVSTKGQSINSRLTSQLHAIPDDAHVIFSMEMKFKRRTFESAIKGEVVIYNLHEPMIRIFRHVSSSGSVLEFYDNIKPSSVWVHQDKGEVSISMHVLSSMRSGSSSPMRFVGLSEQELGQFVKVMELNFKHISMTHA